MTRVATFCRPQLDEDCLTSVFKEKKTYSEVRHAIRKIEPLAQADKELPTDEEPPTEAIQASKNISNETEACLVIKPAETARAEADEPKGISFLVLRPEYRRVRDPRRNIKEKTIKSKETTIAYIYHDVPHLEHACRTTCIFDHAKDAANAATNETAAGPSSALGIPAASEEQQGEDAETAVVSVDEILIACY